jgi:hypothetical protein
MDRGISHAAVVSSTPIINKICGVPLDTNQGEYVLECLYVTGTLQISDDASQHDTHGESCLAQVVTIKLHT